MANEEKKDQPGADNSKLSAANIGNASNPGTGDESLQASPGSQLLDEKAEKYLREVASIEDVPDAQDQQEMDASIQETNKEDV
ncbi:MAG: hypothetical protein EOO14_04330 [Chitinophagaceae bacterium]|nr:MAG: hypothetical protein EOO14_04330 [Chitinophagaceae bacterium]